MCFFKNKKKVTLRTRIDALADNKDDYDYITNSQIEDVKKAFDSLNSIGKKDAIVIDRFLTELEKTLALPTARCTVCLDFIFNDMIKLMKNGTILANYEVEKIRYEGDLVKAEIYRNLSQVENLDDKLIPLDEVEKLMRVDYLIEVIKDNDLAKNIKNLLTVGETSFIKAVEGVSPTRAKSRPYNSWNSQRRNGDYMLNLMGLIKSNDRMQIDELRKRYELLDDEIASIDRKMKNPTNKASEQLILKNDRDAKLAEVEEIIEKINLFYKNMTDATKTEYVKKGKENLDLRKIIIQTSQVADIKGFVEESIKTEQEINDLNTLIDTEKAIVKNARNK